MRLKPVDESAPPIIDPRLLRELTQRDTLERETNQFYLRYERAVDAVRLLESVNRHNVADVHPHERDASGVGGSAIERDRVTPSAY